MLKVQFIKLNLKERKLCSVHKRSTLAKDHFWPKLPFFCQKSLFFNIKFQFFSEKAQLFAKLLKVQFIKVNLKERKLYSVHKRSTLAKDRVIVCFSYTTSWQPHDDLEKNWGGWFKNPQFGHLIWKEETRRKKFTFFFLLCLAIHCGKNREMSQIPHSLWHRLNFFS